ncbi:MULTISPECIES: hypothetical protein [Oscillatoriales]|nr:MULTISPECIES: hypothetical protein [Oscillatoriales]
MVITLANGIGMTGYLLTTIEALVVIITTSSHQQTLNELFTFITPST